MAKPVVKKEVDGVTYIEMEARDYDLLERKIKDESVSPIKNYTANFQHDQRGKVWVEASYFNDNDEYFALADDRILRITSKYTEDFQPEIEEEGVDIEQEESDPTDINVIHSVNKNIVPEGSSFQRVGKTEDGKAYGQLPDGRSVEITPELYEEIRNKELPEQTDEVIPTPTPEEQDKGDGTDPNIDRLKKPGITPVIKTQPNPPASNKDATNKTIEDIYARDKALADKAKNWTNFKTFFDLAVNTGQLLRNKFGGKPDTISPTLAPIPTLQSSVETDMNILDNMISGTYAGGLKTAREMGAPELIPGMQANVLGAGIQAAGQISQQELQRRTQEAGLQAQVEGQNAQMVQQADMYNDAKLERAALGLSESNAQLLSNYSSTIADHIRTNISIENQNSAGEALYIAMKNGMTAAEIERLMGIMKANETNVTAVTADVATRNEPIE